jgi:hypothetical protein
MRLKMKVKLSELDTPFPNNEQDDSWRPCSMTNEELITGILSEERKHEVVLADIQHIMDMSDEQVIAAVETYQCPYSPPHMFGPCVLLKDYHREIHIAKACDIPNEINGGLQWRSALINRYVELVGEDTAWEGCMDDD